jgi:hypothetical protein
MWELRNFRERLASEFAQLADYRLKPAIHEIPSIWPGRGVRVRARSSVTCVPTLASFRSSLKLGRIVEVYEEQLRAAGKSDISYSEFLTRLAPAQWQAKEEGALEWRIRRANLPPSRTNRLAISSRLKLS